jgi:hypothetical protein
MNCNDCVELVGELVDGAAHPDVDQAVRRHLDSCASCHALLEDCRAFGPPRRGGSPIEPAGRLGGIRANWPPARGARVWDGGVGGCR